jgi:hypothetical protein
MLVHTMENSVAPSIRRKPTLQLIGAIVTSINCIVALCGSFIAVQSGLSADNSMVPSLVFLVVSAGTAMMLWVWYFHDYIDYRLAFAKGEHSDSFKDQ